MPLYRRALAIRDGIIVAVGDAAAFARQTNQLLDNQDLARDLGARARQRMMDEFSVDRMVQRYAELYRDLCAD